MLVLVQPKSMDMATRAAAVLIISIFCSSCAALMRHPLESDVGKSAPQEWPHDQRSIELRSMREKSADEDALRNAAATQIDGTNHCKTSGDACCVETGWLAVNL